MNKTTLLLSFLVLNLFTIRAQEAYRSFDDDPGDNWNYSTNIPFYALNAGNSDLWSEYSQANGRIEQAHSGPTYFAGRDLDNPHSEAVTGLASPEHILTFDPINVGGLSAEFKFWHNYVNLDKFDYIYYELAYDNGTSWTSPDVHVDVFSTTQGGQFSTNDWEEIQFDIPSGHPYVRMRLVIYQNGNEYLGFDSFELSTSTLSTSNNLIEGFSFGPNPTEGILRLKAKTILEKATVFDVLGKQIITQTGNSTEMSLDITHLSQGVYFAKVESQGIIQTIRVIKK